MRMISLGRTGLCAVAALVLACGCETIERARKAQAEVAPAGKDAPSATGEVKRVDLKGLRLVDYVAWAMNHRPSIEAAHLAVSNAVLELARVTSDRDLQVNLSSGFATLAAVVDPQNCVPSPAADAESETIFPSIILTTRSAEAAIPSS